VTAPDLARDVAGEAGLDPVLLAVLASRFDTIVREMSNTLFRTSRSSVLNMARDFSCCIVTAQDELLSAAEGLQVHVLGAGLQTRWLRELHPDMADGDAYLHNDPYLGNTHTADHTLLVPVFLDGEHVFTTSAKAHQADCGNAEPTTYMAFAKDLYEEGGLNFPCVRIQRNRADVADIIRMCQRRIRVPDIWYGDYLASLGAARIGERRLHELAERYGTGTLRKFITAWLGYSERLTAAAIGRLPAGRLTAASSHDPLPGLDAGIPVTVTVDIEPGAGQITVDLRDNPDCVPAGFNLSEASSTSGAVIGVLNALPEDLPRNAGTFRRIKVLLRDGCVVGRPGFPASASLATTNVLERVINPVQAAFAQLGRGAGLAEGGGACSTGFGVISGTDPRAAGRPFINQLIMGSNGGPGTPVCDGWVTYCMPDAAMVVYTDSVEVIEQRYPILVRSVRLLPDSGGPGEFRGAPATEVDYGPRFGPVTVYFFADFAAHPAQGVWGGQPGSVASVTHIAADGSEHPLPAIGDITLEPGEWLRGCEAGGGGYGDPLARDPARVLADVNEGWITPDAARAAYGVTLTRSPTGWQLTEEGPR
jgi:N-methylhydantoinase B